MQVSITNDVKIYNLSAGKSLPDWISERKRRLLVKKVKNYFFSSKFLSPVPPPPTPGPVLVKGIVSRD
jgi:hypothetical protein